MIAQLLRFASSRARRLLIAELAAIVLAAILQGAAFLLLVPALRALFAGDDAELARWLTVTALVGVAYAVAHFAASQLGMSASTAVLDSLLARLGDRLVKLPSAWFAKDRSGTLSGIATDGAMFVSSTPYSILRLILTGFITPGVVLIGMYAYDWRLAAAMTAMVPVIWFGFRWLRAAVARGDALHAAAVAEASSRVIEFARAQPALRTAPAGSISERLVSEALDEQHRRYRGMLMSGSSGIALFAGIVQLTVTLVLVLGAYLAIGGDADIPTLIALLVLAIRFNEPIVAAGDMGGGIAVAQTTLDQFDELDRVATLPEPETPGRPADWSIEFDGVTFGYGTDPVLRDLSFAVPSGSMTAIVGPSGSGKTTITKLIARFYDPERGTVRIGGVPVPELGSDVVEAAVSPVFQDVYLFDESILDNIWMGAPELSRHEVIDAATRARADEVAERLPDGWDTGVGEGGSRLSGGERQRVSIARALLKDAPIVLLDEATSALDIGNEIAIGAAIDGIRAGRTLVVVAHRLQTIMTADQIIMLDGEGGIREQGGHDELLAADGAYARYWRDRVAAAGWQLAPDADRLDPERTQDL